MSINVIVLEWNVWNVLECLECFISYFDVSIYFRCWAWFRLLNDQGKDHNTKHFPTVQLISVFDSLRLISFPGLLFIPVAIGSLWVVPSFDEISFSPVMNNVKGVMWQLSMYVAILGHKIFTLCKSKIRFTELKALLASIWMNPCVVSFSKDSLLHELLLRILILKLRKIIGNQ